MPKAKPSCLFHLLQVSAIAQAVAASQQSPKNANVDRNLAAQIQCFGCRVILPVAGSDRQIYAVALLTTQPVLLVGIEAHPRPLPCHVLDLSVIAKPDPQVGIEG